MEKFPPAAAVATNFVSSSIADVHFLLTIALSPCTYLPSLSCCTYISEITEITSVNSLTFSLLSQVEADDLIVFPLSLFFPLFSFLSSLFSDFLFLFLSLYLFPLSLFFSSLFSFSLLSSLPSSCSLLSISHTHSLFCLKTISELTP